jgi:hypothetical protein
MERIERLEKRVSGTAQALADMRALYADAAKVQDATDPADVEACARASARCSAFFSACRSAEASHLTNVERLDTERRMRARVED